MKKYILIFSIIGIVLFLSSFTFRTNYGFNQVEVVAKDIDGHKYIITTNCCNGKPGGIAIIHAESCRCNR